MPDLGFDLPAHSSYSQVTTMLHCGEQYRLSRGMGLPVVPGWALVGGSAVHETTEIIDQFDSPPDNVREIFAEVFEKETQSQIARWEGKYTREDFHASGRASQRWPNKEDDKWWLENGPVFVSSWINWRRVSPMDIHRTDDGELAIEWEATVELAGLPVKVIIDRVMTSAFGLVIIDLKSGANLPKDSMQLGIYAEALRQTHGLDVRYGQFFDARKGVTTVAYDLSEWPKKRLDYIFGSVRKMQEDGIYLPNPSNMCNACGVRAYCKTMGGELSHTVPQVWESM